MYYTEQLLGHVAHNNSELRAILKLIGQSNDYSDEKVMVVARIDQLITDNENIMLKF